VTLSSTRGTPTVVNFFASWCPDCKAELASFATLAARTAGRMAIIGVDSNDNNGAAAQTLLTAAKATYPVGVDPDATVATSYQIDALPVTYFLDGRGRVVHVSFGTQTLAELEHWSAVLTGSVAT
jgi:thiol-disulfide isomerase/thioredoxin